MELMKVKEKEQLRKKLLAKLANLAKNEEIRRSKNAADKLSNSIFYKKAKTVMFYYPIKGEVDVKMVIRKALSAKKVCLPVTDLISKQLRVYHIKDLDCGLVKGSFGINEPNKKEAEEVDPKKIDLVVVPGLAFDYKKNRLGRGGGFYDRLLEKIPDSIKKIGIAFDFQILESLPVNLARDQKVDLVVTDSKIVE